MMLIAFAIILGAYLVFFAAAYYWPYLVTHVLGIDTAYRHCTTAADARAIMALTRRRAELASTDIVTGDILREVPLIVADAVDDYMASSSDDPKTVQSCIQALSAANPALYDDPVVQRMVENAFRKAVKVEAVLERRRLELSRLDNAAGEWP
jgi:hypothetical protein